MTKRFSVCLFFPCIIPALIGIVGAKTISIDDFGGKPDGSDTTPALRRAIEACQSEGATKLVFPKGTYEFQPHFATEKYLFISNNDEGLKRIAFPLLGTKNLEIDGQGSLFLFDGTICPLVLDHCEGVTLRNFSFDFSRPFHSEALIVNDPEGGLDVRILPGFPFEVSNGTLVFTSGSDQQERQTTTTSRKQIFPYGSLLEYDSEKRETAFMAKDYWVPNGVAVRELGDGVLRLMVRNLTGTPGNRMVFGPKRRDAPGIVISDSRDTVVEDVTIHHAGGMALIAQRSHNVLLRRMNVQPREGIDRFISATADATHYVNCSGKIEMAHCIFKNQKDDPSNLHGIYARVVAKEGERAFVAQLVHPQQFGFEFIQTGDELEFVHGESLITHAKAKVAKAMRINKEFTRVVLEGALPPDLKIGDAVAEIRDYAEVHIHHCRMSGNRARGFLLNCRGKTVIEDNYFHIPGSAILFEGDARFWFEQAGVSDCVIRRNVFDNCNFGVWGTATIEVKAGIVERYRDSSRYNRNIRIEDNVFRVFDRHALVRAYSVDGLTIRGNRVEFTDAYPRRGLQEEFFDVQDSDRVLIEDNITPPLPEAWGISRGEP